MQPVCQTKPLIHQLKSFHCRVMKESRTVFHSFLPMSLLTPETKTLLCLSAPPLPHPREFSSWHSPAQKAMGFKTEILQNRIHGIKQQAGYSDFIVLYLLVLSSNPHSLDRGSLSLSAKSIGIWLLTSMEVGSYPHICCTGQAICREKK